MKKLILFVLLSMIVIGARATTAGFYKTSCYDPSLPFHFYLDPSSSTSNVPNEELIAYWDFGNDGTFDVTSNCAVTITYSGSVGSNTVRLKVVAPDGSYDEYTNTWQCNTDPPTGCCVATPKVLYHQVDFNPDCSTDPINEMRGIRFDFDNDGVWDKLNNTTNHIEIHYFPAPGQHTVKYQVIDASGNADAIKTIVTNAPNVAPFANGTVYPREGDVTTDITFSSYTSYDPDQDDITVEWDFDGNGTWDITGLPPGDYVYNYQASGRYTAKLRTKDAFGLYSTSIASFEIDIAYLPPVAVLTSDVIEITQGETVSFEGCDSYVYEGGTISLEFTPEDYPVQYGGTTCYGGVWDHTYNTAGVHTARLRVADIFGTWSQWAEIAITVNSTGGGGGNDPTPVLTSNISTGYVGEAIEFSGCDSYDPLGNPLNLEFTPDDVIVQYSGSTCSGGVWNHAYTSTGVKVAKLRMGTPTGWSDYAELPVTILTAVNAANTANTYEGTKGVTTFIFNGYPSTGDNLQYQWDFDYNGTTPTWDATTPTAQKKYYVSKTYNVLLRVTNTQTGKSDDEIKQIIVRDTAPIGGGGSS